jgi:SAM-dependent methyltransferase
MILRKDAVELEEGRLCGLEDISQYKWFKERHRVFPAVFEQRQHKKILDLSAGVGCAMQRIRDLYNADLLCNDISPTCLKILNKMGLSTVSFDIDNPEKSFPFPDGEFDALISLVTIEHLMHPDHFLKEACRILRNGAYFYLSTPNYAAPEYAGRLLLSGRTFHNPLGSEESRYEFYSHIRYYTYRTLIEFVRSFGFAPETTYIALPGGSARYKALFARSKVKALAFRYLMWFRHHLLSPRYASEPIVCFKKTAAQPRRKPKKVVL